MQLQRAFTKVYHSPRKPLMDKPFTRALDDIIQMADAIDQQVIEDVRFALTGEEPKTEAPADSGCTTTEK
jgi:hypothetical protein